MNVGQKQCALQACSIQHRFGVAGSKIGVHCKEHAKNGMVDVGNKNCAQQG